MPTASLPSSYKAPPYYEWLTHTNFSFLTAVSHPHEYVARAVSLSYGGIGICDYDGLYGIVRAYTAFKKWADKKSFKIFYGSELHLKKDHHLPIPYQDTIVLYALNLQGYQNLCQILTDSHIAGKKEGHLLFEDLLKKDLQNLVSLLPMRGLIRTLGEEATRERWSKVKKAMPGRTYAVISRHLNPSEDAWITPSLRLAKELDIPIIFSQDCYFHSPENKDLCDLVQAIRTNLDIKKAMPYMFVNNERCLKSLQDIYERYRIIPGYKKALENSHHLAERFQLHLHELKYQYPKEMIPEGESAHSYLTKLVWQHAKERFGFPLQPKIFQLLKRELDLVEELSFADYFLTVWDIVRFARKNKILCQGRGSAANSAICYVIGITAVDPSKFDLLFERFISVERGDPPDIDVDFEHERREEVIQYVYNHYGRGRAAMVANVITFRSRGATRFAGKALGIPERMLADATNLQKMRAYRKGDEGASLALEKLEKAYANTIPFKLWGQFAKRLIGYPRHMGIHSGGFVLTDGSINALVPQEPATMPNRTVVQWSKVDLEELGFFKIDLLSLGMLSAVRKSLDLINRFYDKDLSIDKIPQGDQKTYAMIQEANTTGTFQIESRAQMSMLPRLKPKCFYDLVVQVGIIRPGPIQGGLIHPYLRRRGGLEPVVYAHKDLEPILKRTLGVPIFQEQVMRIAMSVGDFTAGEADTLRKQIGAFSINKDLSPMVAKLERGMRRNRISEGFIKQTIDHLQGFANYGFPESHAVSFALIAYASSWLKCHYPAAFFTALLNSQPMGFYSRHALIQAAMRDGVSILPICINSSFFDATMEKVKGQFAIRLGFNMVSGLQKEAAFKLIQTRERLGKWQSLDVFLRAGLLYRGDLTALAAAGAFLALGAERRCALWIAEAASYAPYLEEDLGHIFPEESEIVRIERDFEATGTSLESHPAKVIKEQHWCYPLKVSTLVLAKNLNMMPRNLMVSVFGMVLVRQAPPTAKGMVFFTLEDETGFLNLAFKPHVYESFRDSINGQGFLCVEGRLQKPDEQKSHSLLVKRVYRPYFEEAKVIALEKEDTVQKVTRRSLTKARNYM